jgi:hypothetical protein
MITIFCNLGQLLTKNWRLKKQCHDPCFAKNRNSSPKKPISLANFWRKYLKNRSLSLSNATHDTSGETKKSSKGEK